MNKNNLQQLEQQDYMSKVNVYYKDAQYPLHNINKVCPPPHWISPVRNGVKLDHCLVKTYRDFLINFNKSYAPAAECEEQDSIETRVLAIERRYGMTSLIVEDPDNKKSCLKVLLNPI